MLQLSEIKNKFEEFEKNKKRALEKGDQEWICHLERLQAAYEKEYVKALIRIPEEYEYKTPIDIDYWR